MDYMKDQVIEHCRRAANLRIWKKRLPGDDGWEFQASERCPDWGWLPATPAEIQLIAARALMGLW